MAATAKAGKPPRARPVPRAITAAPAPQANGVLRLTSTSDEPEQREPLFYIDDTEYTIPVDPPASIGLAATHMMAAERARLVAIGIDDRTATFSAMGLAQDYTLQEMLGEEAYKALRECKTLKGADLRRLMEVCSERAMAALEDEENPNH